MCGDMRQLIFTTKEQKYFLPCPFCGGTDQRVVEGKMSYGERVVRSTVAVCCDGCGLEFPVTFVCVGIRNSDKPLREVLLEHVKAIRDGWNTRREDDE